MPRFRVYFTSEGIWISDLQQENGEPYRVRMTVEEFFSVLVRPDFSIDDSRFYVTEEI